MKRFIVLASLAALTVAEVALVLWLADTVGWLLTLLILAADMLLGIVIARTSGAELGTLLRRDPADRTEGSVGDPVLKLAAGLVIALPGLITSLLGLPLLIPGVRRAVGGWITPRAERLAEDAMRNSGVTVITETTVEGETRSRMAPTDVIKGEVIHGDVVQPEPTYPPREIEGPPAS